MNEYRSVGERASAMVGRRWYRSDIGFGRIAHVHIVWANVVRYTIRLTNGTLVCLMSTDVI